MPCTSICRKILPVRKLVTLPLAFLHKNGSFLDPMSRNHRYITASTLLHTNSCNGNAYTVSYLINQCGLSPEAAISTSKNAHLETPQKPDSVLALLRNHGFNKTQIAKVVQCCPFILRSNPDKTLLPKLQFLQSMGASNPDLARILSTEPNLFGTSIKNNMIPCYNFLKSVLQSNEKIIATLNNSPRILAKKHMENLVPNLTVLKDLRVPQSCVVLLLSNFPRAVTQKPDKFKEIVNELLGMGFDPLKSMFVLAIPVRSAKDKKSKWARAHGAYKKWGWSDDEILLAFKKHPHCMALTEKNISGTMDFFVNKMGRKSMDIARCPTALCYNLEKRIIPRCSVIQVLSMKGFIKNLSLTTILMPLEKYYFLERFVKKYEDVVPQLLSVYQGKVNCLEL